MVRSIVEAVAGYAQMTPDKFCLADAKKEATYGEYWSYIYGYAAHLKEIGVAKGDNVVVRNAQNMETLICGLAIQLTGAVFVPVEKNAADSRILEIIESTQAVCYIAAKALEVPCLYEKMTGVTTYQAAQADFETFAYPNAEDTAEILFTTGTTGKSKGIELTHKNVVAVAENVIDGVEMGKENVELIPVPVSHSHGLRRYYANMLNGSAAVILDGVIFTGKVFDRIEQCKVTAIDLVPAALSALFKLSGDRLGDYKDQLEYIQLGSAAIPEPDQERLRRLLPHTRLYNFYGTTESGCSCILDFNAHQDKKSCIGRPTCHSHFIFADEQGNPIEASEENPGFLACAGDMNMKGYYQSPKLNEETIRNGYIYTKDLSYMGEDGFIYMLGRQDDVIITGGSKVAPDEIEGIACEFAGIADCACIPVDSPILGKEPKLFVELERGAIFDESAIYQFLKDRLEAYKVPKLIEQIDKIPRTYNGKIQRKELAAREKSR